MLALGAYEKCKQYLKLHSAEPEEKQEIFPCISISRQTGAGSYEVSNNLLNLLQQNTKQPEDPWTYFNKELIAQVLEDFNLPKNFSTYFVEDKYNHISDAVNELLGVKPSEWTIVQKTTEIILRLSRFGKTIIVGRGSVVINAKLPNCFQVRLIASLENRIKHIQEVFDLSKPKAMEYITKEETSRNKFLKSHFFKDVDDPSLYHLILNTSKFTYQEAAEIIFNLVQKRYPQCFNV
ncbi:MAG: cytidylate kinase-like family protein [Ignavibacteriaceae bacterium]|jgi:cytidylate kinase|nr:cytidylate kinase-like family protein [Ignavibacteriaceae bacterium]